MTLTFQREQINMVNSRMEAVSIRQLHSYMFINSLYLGLLYSFNHFAGFVRDGSSNLTVLSTDAVPTEPVPAMQILIMWIHLLICTWVDLKRGTTFHISMFARAANILSVIRQPSVRNITLLIIMTCITQIVDYFPANGLPVFHTFWIELYISAIFDSTVG